MVAEDDPIVALDLEQQVTSQGHVVCGPHAKVSDAINSLSHSPPEVAIIDYHLLDGVADKLIEALHIAEIPFVIVTVSSKRALPGDIKPIWVFSKPFDMSHLSNLMNEVVRGRPH